MAQSGKASDGKQNSTQHKTQPTVQSVGPENASSNLLIDSPALQGANSISSQAAMMQQMPAAQRQAMMGKIGRQQGNQHVQRLVGSVKPRTAAPVQAKMTVNEPGDSYEQEADAVAEEVMRMPAPPPMAPPADPEDNDSPHNDIQRSGGEASTPDVSTETESRIESMRGGGSPLPDGERQFFESRMGADFSSVRIHTGPDAVQSSNDIQAKAFTTGNDIAFNDGAYQPGTHSGRQLIAHELTHVIQQGAAPTLNRQAFIGPQTKEEVQRNDLLRQAVHPGQMVNVSTMGDTAGGSIQRLPDFITDELADYARRIPGYTLFTVIIGFNPLTGDRVQRNAMNLLDGLMGMVPFGSFIFDTLRSRGILDAAFEWVEGELGRVNLSVSRIEQTIEAAWDEMDLLEGFSHNLEILERHFLNLYNDVESFATSLVSQIIELIKDAALSVAEELLADSPAWDLIKKVIHYDPLRGEAVDATTVEILEDFLMLIGKETELEQMREKGTLQETADWLDTQIAQFQGLLGQLTGLVTAAWETIQPENLPNLMENLQGLATDAINLIQDAVSFASTIATKVLELIKHSLLGLLSEHAHKVPGFHLMTVILGRNPVTGEAVERNAENIIKGFITLLPNGESTYEQLKESGTIEQAAANIEGAIESLGISWEFITGLFTSVWDMLTIESLINPIDTFAQIIEKFGEPIVRLVSFVQTVVIEIFKLILELMNFPSDILGQIIGNAITAFEAIKDDPLAFFINMLQSLKLGFTNFFSNIFDHLLGGVTDWLFGNLEEAGISPPTDFSFESILGFVLEVLGLTMDNIWEKLGERIGPDKVEMIKGAIDRLTGIWNFIVDVQERGITAIWEYIQSQLSNLWGIILEEVSGWIITKIITQVTSYLLSLLDPTGIMAVINSFIAIFNAIESAIEYFRDMLEIVNDYVSTIAAVATGNVVPGAERMEQGLSNAMPVAIGFLANQVGLGNVADKMQDIIGAVREVIDNALVWLIDKAVTTGESVLNALGIGDNTQEEESDPSPENEALEAEAENDNTPHSESDMDQWWLAEDSFTDPTGEPHRLLFNGSGSGAVLVVRSEEQVVLDWLAVKQTTVSDGLRPMIAEAREAYTRFISTKNDYETLRQEFLTLSDADKQARRAERETVYRVFRAALRDVGRTFSAIPVEGEPDEVILKLPSQKAASVYQGHIGRLQHSRQRPERHTDQIGKWEEHVQAGMPAQTLAWGLRLMEFHSHLGRDARHVLRPNWDPNGISMSMQVDHIIEWQVRPIGDESLLDEPWNYELLDGRSNSGSGSAIRSNIQEERERIADPSVTGDQTWLHRDLTFTTVNGGGSGGRRWSVEDIQEGRHLHVFYNKHGGPSPDSPENDISPQEALDEQSSENDASEEILQDANINALIEDMVAAHPAEAQQLRVILQEKIAGKTLAQIAEGLGMEPNRKPFTDLWNIVKDSFRVLLN